MAKIAIAAAVILLVTYQAHGAQVTPVQKVIQLLEGMVKKGTADKQAEEVQFSAYKSWCESVTKEKEAAIAKGNEAIEVLTADIQKAESDARDLGAMVASLDTDISTWEGDQKAAAKVRDIENNDYTATHADYSSSIQALEEGLKTLRAQNHNIAQAGSLLQGLGQAPWITPQAKQRIDAFIAQDPSVQDEDLAIAAPQAQGFESGLQGIVDMLEGLLAKFEDEKTGLEKEEVEAKNSFAMLSMDLTSQIEAATEARSEKAEEKAKALQAAANAKGDLADVSTTRDDDTKYLSDVTATCSMKAHAFEDRQAVRAGEIEAIGKAVEILSGGSVAGMSEKHLPQLMQLKGSSFAQLRSSNIQDRCVAFLKSKASQLDSRVLSMLAVRAAADPFKKVKKMIKDLLVKLMEDATSEAETKGFCDTEMKTNEHTRKEKTAMVEQLTADSDELTASISMITEEMGKLSNELAALNDAMGKATAIRTTEKSKNLATILDAQDAQAAVSNAVEVLREFYGKAAESTSLSQQAQNAKQAQPEIFSDEPYQGMTAAKGGVMGMLEVIESDFVRLESETTAQEQNAQSEYDDYIKVSTLDKTEMTKTLEHKTQKRAHQEGALQETKSSLEGTQKELDAALKTYEKLKPTCVSGGAESFEDRTAQRKEEIESLQEALRILNGEDIVFAQQ